MKNKNEHEKDIAEYIKKGDTRAAVNLLVKIIVLAVRQKNFTKAEKLRKTLFDVDALALNEIIMTGEMIEEAKSRILDKSHMDIWLKLYSTLTSEEANGLYYVLKNASYEQDETIYTQGHKNACLYFIDQGTLKVIYRLDNDEFLVKNLSSGDLAGEDSFFPISFCTTSLVTFTHVKLKYLERKELDLLSQDFPELEFKLRDYCRRFKSVDEILNKNGRDRRIYKRIRVKGEVRFYLLTSAGKKEGKMFKGELADVSIQGVSFHIRADKITTARRLLGRGLYVYFNFNVGGINREISTGGTVLGVSSLVRKDYAIHMCFNKLQEDEIKNAIDSN